MFVEYSDSILEMAFRAHTRKRFGFNSSGIFLDDSQRIPKFSSMTVFDSIAMKITTVPKAKENDVNVPILLYVSIVSQMPSPHRLLYDRNLPKFNLRELLYIYSYRQKIFSRRRFFLLTFDD